MLYWASTMERIAMAKEVMSRTLKFTCYENEGDFSELPEKPGIYFVYAFQDDSVDLKNALENSASDGEKIADYLLYIGESHDFQERISRHEKRTRWESWARKNNRQLFYYFARLDDEDEREATEEAMIAKYKPKFNFPFCKCAVLDRKFLQTGEFEIVVMLSGTSNSA